MDDIEQHYPKLRRIVVKYDTLRRRTKWQIPFIFVGSIAAIAFPPLGFPTAIILVMWWVTNWRYGFAVCPRCKEYFFSSPARLFCMAANFDPRAAKCRKCELKVCELPEVDCQKPEPSHSEEWLK